MTKAALAPAMMIALAVLGRIDPAGAEAALPCNALCRVWMGVNEAAPPPHPQAMIELHPDMEAVSASTLPSPQLADPDHRAGLKDTEAMQRPPHRPRSSPKTDPGPRLVATAAGPRTVAPRSTKFALAPVAAADPAPRTHPVIATAPLQTRAVPALVPAPEPAMEPIFGAAPRPDAFATRALDDTIPAESAAAQPPSAAPTQGAARDPRAVVAVAVAVAQEPLSATRPAAQVTAAVQEPPAADALSAAPPKRQAVMEGPTIVATLGPEAAPQTEAGSVTVAPRAVPASPRAPLNDANAAPKPSVFPPPLDVIATLMLTVSPQP